MKIFDLVDNISYRKQRRRPSATTQLKPSQIGAADFETIDGSAWLFTAAWWEGEERRSDIIEYGNGIDFTLAHFIRWISERTGRLWRRGGGAKGVTHPYLFYWNMTFDASVIIKEMAEDAIDQLLDSMDCIVDAHTHKLVEVKRGKNRQYQLTSAQKEMELVEVHWLPRKNLRLTPMGALAQMIDEKGYSRNIGRIEMFDIMQFHGGGSLDHHSKTAMKEGHITQTKLGDIDRARINEADYRKERRDDLFTYALVDSEVTLELATLKIAQFEEQGVRMTMPYSLASIAERNLLDCCEVPTLNEMMGDRRGREVCLSFWNGYAGGWFETTGCGRVDSVRAFDLASAYPYIMYHLPDFSQGYWSRGNENSVHLWWEWMEERQPYSLGIAEAIVRFPAGLPLYPGLVCGGQRGKSTFGCTICPQQVRGWFTADEIEEFKKWDATIHIDRWHCHFPDPEAGYPLRPFVEKWYNIKYEQGLLKETDEFDKRQYQVAKDCINSCYGKLIQTTENEDETLKPGKMWNPIWGAVVTGATRARMAEFARVNGVENVVAMATDGIIMRNHPDLFLPELPLPACHNLGEWEEETPDGLADAIIMMSGVYALRGKEGTVKVGYRGSPALFIGRDDQPSDWFEFCEENGDLSHLIRDEENHPNSRPYSLGEARIKGDYSLVNVFRVVRATLRALGDSNKRRWMGETPETFSDLNERWWESDPHRSVP